MKIQKYNSGWQFEPSTIDEEKHLDFFFKCLNELYGTPVILHRPNSVECPAQAVPQPRQKTSEHIEQSSPESLPNAVDSADNLFQPAFLRLCFQEQLDAVYANYYARGGRRPQGYGSLPLEVEKEK